MMTTPNDFYREMAQIIGEDKPGMLAEFERRIEGDDPKQVFLWLTEKSERGELPVRVEPLLTDFFYSIR